MQNQPDHEYSLAVIGLSCRFPGAQNYHEFWHNLLVGKETITHFSTEELIAAGIDETLLNQSNYVKSRGIIPDADEFDPAFFGFSPQDAKILDPQIRLFLMQARNALEDAGYCSEKTAGKVGVFAGQSQISSYLNEYLLSNTQLRNDFGDYYLYLHNSNDFLATKVSYQFNLTGPSQTLQTACSTSLVAVCEACQHLLDYQCDTAIAGGVSLQFPLVSGYLYQAGMILSPDGHCRAFDAKANGTVPGNGVGVVILKRYTDALAAGDHIYAVVRGFATNNDGNRKVGYSAPSLQGQAAVIQEALATANCDPHSITYIEAHGTGTPQGDPIELSALKQVFATHAPTPQKTCALGSVKTNIGHCDIASGVAGFIKTLLALYYQKIPPTLHFKTLNPNISLENSPFFINDQVLDWSSQALPRRAGVSSFGIGGTNAHVVLEETPGVKRCAANPEDTSLLLILSAKTAVALAQIQENLAHYVAQTPNLNGCDVAYTCQIGRELFQHRCFFVVKNHHVALATLKEKPPTDQAICLAEEITKGIAFLFSDQTDHGDRFNEIYRQESTFRDQVNQLMAYVKAKQAMDVSAWLFATPSTTEPITDFIPPLCYFIQQYSLAKLWLDWGILPAVVLGHGLGEYAAMAIAGIFSPEVVIDTLISSHLGLPDEPIFSPVTQPNTMPCLSSSTGNYLNTEQFTQANDWMKRGSEPNHLADALLKLKDKDGMLLEIGASNAFSHVVQKILPHAHYIPSFALANAAQDGYAALLTAVGKLWLQGVPIDWVKFNKTKPGRRISLPTYPYAREKYLATRQMPQTDFKTYHYEPAWKYDPFDHSVLPNTQKHTILWFHDPLHACVSLQTAFIAAGHCVIRVYFSGHAHTNDQASYVINPDNPADYQACIEKIQLTHRIDAVVFCCAFVDKTEFTQGLPTYFLQAFYLMQALSRSTQSEKIVFSFISRHTFKMSPNDTLDPFKSLLVGMTKNLDYELPTIRTKFIDVDAFDANTCHALVREVLLPHTQTMAYRYGKRFALLYQQIVLPPAANPALLLKTQGCYLFVGGLGGVGLSMADTFSTIQVTHLVFIQRSVFPCEADWDEWLKTHREADVISQKIKSLQSIQARGSHVRVLQADVTNAAQMQRAFSQAKAQFGSINGVIHAAGLPDGKLFHFQNASQLTQVMAAKVSGSLVLSELLKNENCDFLLLCSALTAITGSPGQLGYCSANHFMDSLAQMFVGQSMRVFSINWDQWKHTGMALALSQLAQALDCQSLLNHMGLEKADQIAGLWQALSCQSPQFIIAGEPLSDRIQKYQQLTAKYLNTKTTDLNRPISVATQTTPHEVYTMIVKQFKVYLGDDHIDETTDFFTRGGDSLLAVQLAHTLENHCQVKLDPHHIQLYPTPKALGDYCLKQLSTASSTQTNQDLPFSLVCLQPGNHQRLLFLIHPVGGTFYVYRNLIKSLPQTLTIYGIQVDDLSASGERDRLSIEQIASSYVDLVKLAQPHGPYHLGGFSFGGVVAYEMARQLCVDHEVVDTIIMIDSPHQQTLPRAFKDNADVMAYLLHLGANYDIDPDDLRKLDEAAQIQLFLQQGGRIERELPSIKTDVLKRFFDLFKVNSAAMAQYHPLSYPGESIILFFKASEKDSVNPINPEAGWQTLLGRKLKLHQVAGNHITMMDEPNVAQIGLILATHFTD